MPADGPARLAELSWPVVADRAARSVLVIPLGATEQHGPQLPYTVDTEVAVELAERLATARPDVVVAPAMPYGASGEHAAFPGTLSIGQRATELVVVELVRSADAFRGVLVLCGHGGNAEPLRRAVELLRGEGRDVHSWAPTGPPEDSHAGWVETSVLLAVRPSAVGPVREPGESRPLPEIIGRLRAEGVRGVSANGVLGDPTGAGAVAGRDILAGWASGLLDRFDHWWPR